MNRRQYLKTAGIVSASAVPLVGTVSAGGRGNPNTAGVENKASKFLLKGEYDHTWALTDFPYLASASAQIGPLGLSMDLSNSSKLWGEEVTVAPGESEDSN